MSFRVHVRYLSGKGSYRPFITYGHSIFERDHRNADRMIQVAPHRGPRGNETAGS